MCATFAGIAIVSHPNGSFVIPTNPFPMSFQPSVLVWVLHQEDINSIFSATCAQSGADDCTAKIGRLKLDG